ncbi:hypothetical protein G3O08_20305 [Cryomorpha ignava]|uniref:Uncharacterized protein n=1 Tax=Cryomorpha ignava TaxID=101383 RepID=A0A7K3WWD4_9FLAO|nr:hypothetical protein [Cryomorpha ignava]NEN25836.1 hypothetical protein [Cryomorpha ignava]
MSKLAIRCASVTIDAIGFQEEIATTIKASKAEYVLAVRSYWASLYEQTIDEFSLPKTGCIQQKYMVVMAG